MNEGQKQLYAYLRDNGLTDLDSNKFFSSYSDPSKSKEIHSYMKQNGLTDLDANAFHVAYFSPVKKKSTTGSQSVQKKKPTSSATIPSWMQESLESSAKKEQPKKTTGPQVVKSNELKKEQTAANAGLTKKDVQAIASMGGGGSGGVSGVGAINAAPKKQEERDFDVYYGYPGQEKNEYRISNGRWQRKYGEKWVEVSNQGSISSLTKFFGKEKEIAKEEVFTGFPGKEENKYRVSELQNGQKVWEVQRAGQKDYTVIGDQGSVDALNRQFNKKIEYTENAQLKREAEINRRESASEDFKTVTGKLVGKESDEVAKYLTKMYGDRGFRFQTVGTFTDRIRVSAEGTDRSEVFDLDNWRDDTDSSEALKLRKFLSENQQLGDYIDLEREEKKKAEEDVLGAQNLLTKESAEIQMARLTGAGSQAEFKLAQKQNTEENIIKDLNKNSTEVVEARKLLIRADYDTKQRIDDLTRTAKTDYEKQELAAIAVANKDKFVENNRVDNDYLNDLNNSSKGLDQSFKTLNSDVEDFNRYIKENNITKDQLESDPELLAQKQELQVRYDQIIADAEDLDFENKKIPFIQNQNSRNAALYFAYNETRGSVIGGTWNGLLRGALGSLQTFRVIDKEGLDSLVETFGSSTTKEFTSSENRNDLSRALLSTSESLGAAAAAVFTGGLAAEGTVASKVLGFVPYFSVSYNEIKNEIDAIPGMNKVPWYKKEALSIAYGLGVGYLDKLSTDFQVKGKISNNIGRNLVLRSIAGLPKGATAEAIEMAIASNFKKDIAAGAIKIVAGQVLEGTTEGVQSAYGTGLKEVYDWMNGVDEFDSREWVSQAFEEAYYGALGGAIMSTPSALIKGIKNGFGRLDPKDMELARKVIEDSNMRSMVITDIKTKLMSGEITKEEANAQMGAINESMSLFTKIPDNLSAEDTSKAMDLIKERSAIEQEIQGKDKDLVVSRTKRITEINNELKTISEDATKKSTEQEVTAEGGGVQREGVVEGQPEVGQPEGTVGQATEQGTDTGNRPVEGRSQEEEIKKLRADEQAELTEAIPNIDEYKVDGEIDKASMPEDVLAKYDEIYNKYDAKITPLLSATETVPVPKIAETTDTKTYSEALSSAKAELKAEGKGLDLQVSDVSQEEADAIVKEGGKIFMTEDGLAGAYVKKDGYMGGLFKSPKATYKEVAKLLQQARIKVGGKFMDAYATELEKIYVKNGFRPIARMKFNEEYAPEGWDAPGSALAGKPDVVFFAYDPEGKYKIGDGQYVEDYDAAYEMAKNFDSKVANEADKLEAILDKKATVSKGVISKDEVSKRVGLAQKALSAILPDVKFVVHDTDEAFRKAVGEMNMKEQSSAGAYDMGSKTIHVNATKANNRTVSHEVFHAIIISKTSSDKQLQKLTSNMVNAVIKSLKQTGTNQDVINYLEDFASNYEDNLQNEEKLAELNGILGENMIELPLPTQNIIKRFLDRLAKIFGLKEMTDREAVEFMNTMSSKVEAGKEITAKEFKGGKKVSKPSEGLTTRKQYGNDKVKLEVRYLEQERMDELIKNGLVQEVDNLSAFNGKKAVTTSPDDMLVGFIYVNGKEVATGNGGIFFVTKFGDVWANSNAGIAKGLAAAINESSKANGGKAYLILVKGSDAKLVSSPQGVTSSLAVTESMLDAGLFSLSDFRNAIRLAVKKAGGDISLSQNGSSKTLKNELGALFSDVTASTFEKRGNVLRDIIANLAKSESASKKKLEIVKFLNGDESKGIGVGVTPKSQSLVDLVAKVSAEELTKGLNVGDIYGVIEINGEVDVFQDKHQSYPYHIKMVDKDGNVSSEKPVLILPKNRKNGRDILTSLDGQTSEELGTGFSGKVGATSNLPYGKGIIQDDSKTDTISKAQIEEEVNTLEEEMKSKVRKQMAVEMQEIKDQSVADGTFMKAPNGKKTNLEETQWLQTRTKAFKAWFGDWENDKKNASKVLDENKEPLVVWHTSPNEFNIFDFDYSDIFGFHFGTKKASEDILKVRLKNKGNSKPYFLNIRKKLKIKDTKDHKSPYSLYSQPYSLWDKINIGDFDISSSYDGSKYIKKEVDKIKKAVQNNKNYDGYFYENKYEDIGSISWVVGNSNQIKLADGTNTKFDVNEPSIRKQKASKQADVIVKKGKDAGLSDAGIREYMNRNGFSGDEITNALQKYNDKKEGIFNDPNAAKIKKFAITMRKKLLSARGFMPKSGFKSNEERLANIARSLNMADRNISDLNRAIKKMKLSEQENQDLMDKFDDYVRGDKSITLPLNIKKIADSMRDHIDSLSTDLINSGLVDGDLKEKIKNNIGSYMNRAYAVYDNANWKNEITDEVRQKAINFLKIQMRPIAIQEASKFNMSVEETLDKMVTNKINEILTKDMSSDFASGGRKGSKNIDVLKKMEDIPAEIRMLMGEYTDPVQSYAKTILKMSALAANHQFLSQVKESGMGVFLFEKNDPRTPEGYTYKIAAEGSKSMEPLNGLYTSKEIAEAFNNQSSELGYWLKLYMKTISLVKWGKTVGSPLTHLKNLLGNLGFVMANGHWRLNEMGKSFNTIRADIMNSSNEELRSRIDNYIKLGIIKQSAGINELRSMFEDADWDTTILNRINKKAATRWDKIKTLGFKAKNFTENLYQGEDDFFKVFAYENELSRYSKAMFGKKKKDLTDAEKKEVNDVVVNIVKNTYPTASRVPELINMIRRFPFVGNFISFQAESYRTAFNTAHLSMQEIRSDNPGVREIGAQRLAGAVTYTSLKTAILSYFSYMAGMGAVGILGYFTDDEEEKQREKDVRKFVAPWSKNSDLLVISVGKGKIKYVDFSASDPHGSMMKAINAALLGKNSVEGLIDALVTTVEPFVGEEMTTQALLNLRGNVNAYGKPIYNSQDSFYAKAMDIISYLVKAVEPGIVSTGRRFAKSEDLKSELLAGVTGARIYDVDVSENFKFSMMGYKNNISDAKRIYNSAVYSKEATEADKEDAKKRAENAITRIHKTILDEYHAAVRLGANEEDLYNKLKDYGDMSNADIDFMFAEENYFIEYKMPEE